MEDEVNTEEKILTIYTQYYPEQYREQCKQDITNQVVEATNDGWTLKAASKVIDDHFPPGTIAPFGVVYGTAEMIWKEEEELLEN